MNIDAALAIASDIYLDCDSGQDILFILGFGVEFTPTEKDDVELLVETINTLAKHIEDNRKLIRRLK